MRFNTGVAFISNHGFLTADVEFVNYSKARYKAEVSGEDFNFENDAIKAEYQSVVNYKVGGEFRHDIYRVRAGYNYMPDPLAVNDEVDRAIKTFTAGAGVRMQSFFVDLAAMFSNFENRRAPYFVDGADPVASQTFKTTTLLLTFGFTF